MKFKYSRKNRKKVFLIFLLFILLLASIGAVYFVNNLSKYSETEDASASGDCPPWAKSLGGIGCHYGKDTNPNHASIGDAECHPDYAFQVNVSNYNVCNFTHDLVCVQQYWDNTYDGCLFSADWECCSPSRHDGATPERYIAFSDGSLINEVDYYMGEGIDGRLDEASCTRLYGWAGTKSDFNAQTDIFFTIGNTVNQGGIVFNPGILADLPSDDGSDICDFLDNKSDGKIKACKNCDGTSCIHRFDIDLTQFADSAIFNGEAGNKIYAYSSYNGEVSGLMDGPTATQWYLTIPESCGDGWDGESDELPPSVVGPVTPSDDQDGTITPGSGTCNGDIDYDSSGEVNIKDFVEFKAPYVACNSSQDADSSACKMIDLNCDNDPSKIIQDFLVFRDLYVEAVS